MKKTAEQSAPSGYNWIQGDLMSHALGAGAPKDVYITLVSPLDGFASDYLRRNVDCRARA